MPADQLFGGMVAPADRAVADDQQTNRCPVCDITRGHEEPRRTPDDRENHRASLAENPGVFQIGRSGSCASLLTSAVWLVKLRRRRLLDTTKTELSAIAAPASIGLSRPAAANGSAT